MIPIGIIPNLVIPNGIIQIPRINSKTSNNSKWNYSNS